MSIIQNNHEVESVYIFQNDGENIVKRTISAIYYKGILIYELIVGYIFTHDEFSIESADKYILKCKDQ